MWVDLQKSTPFFFFVSHKTKSLMKTLLIALAFACASCGTITQSGKATAYQSTKPKPGEPKRKVKTGPLIVGILFFPSLVVDLVTCELYRKQ